MKAFERMEKAEQRRLETQARLQQKKEELEQKKKVEQEKKKEGVQGSSPMIVEQAAVVDPCLTSMDATGMVVPAVADAVDEEGPKRVPSPPPSNPPPNTTHTRQKGKGLVVQCLYNNEFLIELFQSLLVHFRRKRKASGTPGRRGSRTNSGCSDVLSSPDENSQQSSVVSSSSSLTTTATTGCSSCPSITAPPPQPLSIPTPSSQSSEPSCTIAESDRMSPPVASVSMTSRLKTKKVGCFQNNRQVSYWLPFVS